MLQSLQSLASDVTPESRAALCDRIMNIYFDNQNEPSDIEKTLFGDVTLRLMQDMASDICGRVAERVSSSMRTPHELALTLARSDDEQVYAPVLAHSPVLTDEDLIEIAQESSEGHRLSIAGRESINESVTDALVQTGEISVLRKVTSNTGAKFSNEGLSIVVERSGSDEVLLNCLTERGKHQVGAKPTEFFNQLQTVIKKGLGDLADSAGLDEEFAPDQIEARLQSLLKLRLEDRNRGIRIKALAKDIKEKRRGLEQSFEELSGEDHVRDVVLLVACLLDIPDRAVQGAYINEDPTAFAMLCHALEMDADLYSTLLATRLRKLERDEAQLPQLKKNYQRIARKESQRLLRIIRMNS
ncbi:MAG: DUF2336 domain-containing protein [Pseudomonadota bacterium]